MLMKALSLGLHHKEVRYALDQLTDALLYIIMRS